MLEKDYWKYSESMNSESFRDLMLTYGQDVSRLSRARQRVAAIWKEESGYERV